MLTLVVWQALLRRQAYSRLEAASSRLGCLTRRSHDDASTDSRTARELQSSDLAKDKRWASHLGQVPSGDISDDQCVRLVEEAKAPPSPEPTSPPRWKIYESALAKAIVNSEDAMCEWEIWGVSSREVYVWTVCKVRGPIGTAGSVPAVIYLGENGEILEIETPDDGTGYGPSIRKLFPLEVQNKIFAHQFDAPAAGDRIDERMRTNGPPLIAISGTPLP